MKNEKNDLKVIQPNYLIEKRPRMGKIETQIFLSIILQIKKKPNDKVLYIPVKEIMETWNMGSGTSYEAIDSALSVLSKKTIAIKEMVEVRGEMKRSSFYASLMPMARYVEGAGEIKVEITEAMKPYYLDLSEGYTSYFVSNLVNLKSVYSIRTYELLKQYEVIGKRLWTFQDYKEMLGIPEGTYPRRYDLESIVIKKAQKHINEETDLFVTYKITGRGNRAEIEWTIKNKTGIKKEIEAIRADLEYKATHPESMEEPVMEELEPVVKPKKEKPELVLNKNIRVIRKEAPIAPVEPEVEIPVKRGRGRPRKENPMLIPMRAGVAIEDMTEDELKKQKKREKALEAQAEIERLFREGK